MSTDKSTRVTAADEYHANELARMKEAWADLPEDQQNVRGLIHALHGKINPAAACKFVETGTWP